MKTIEKHILHIESDIADIEDIIARIKRALIAIQLVINKSIIDSLPASEGDNQEDLPF